jgi:hypothetical protein
MTDTQGRGRAQTRAGRSKRPPTGKPTGRAGGRIRYSPGLAEEICARIAGGESLAAVTRRPDMPSPSTIRYWRGKFPAFAEAIAQAWESARALKAGQPVFAEPSNLAELHEEPAEHRRRRSSGARRHRERPQELLPDGRVRCVAYDDAVVEAICERLAAGDTWSEVCARRGFPTWSTLYAWMRRHAGVAERVAQARRIAADLRFDKALDVAMKSEPATVQADKLKVATLLHHAGALDPARFGGAGRGGRAGGDGAVQTIVIKRFERALDDNGESYVRVIDDVQAVER